MKVQVRDADVNRYSSLAEMQAAHKARREKFFGPPAAPPCVPVVAQVAHAAPRAPATVPLLAFVDHQYAEQNSLAALFVPRKPSPVEITVHAIVEAVAARLNVTVEAALTDVTNSHAQLARKLAGALAVRRVGLRAEEAATMLDILPSVVNDGLLIIDPVLREFAVPRTTPLDQVLTLVFDTARAALTTQRFTIHEIKRVVAHEFNVSVAEIMSSRRTANIVKPRQIAMTLAKRLTLKSLPEIGRQFGGRDHTTVLHAVRKFAPAVECAEQYMQPGASVVEWARMVDAAFCGKIAPRIVEAPAEVTAEAA